MMLKFYVSSLIFISALSISKVFAASPPEIAPPGSSAASAGAAAKPFRIVIDATSDKPALLSALPPTHTASLATVGTVFSDKLTTCFTGHDTLLSLAKSLIHHFKAVLKTRPKIGTAVCDSLRWEPELFAVVYTTILLKSDKPLRVSLTQANSFTIMDAIYDNFLKDYSMNLAVSATPRVISVAVDDPLQRDTVTATARKFHAVFVKFAPLNARAGHLLRIKNKELQLAVEQTSEWPNVKFAIVYTTLFLQNPMTTAADEFQRLLSAYLPRADDEKLDIGIPTATTPMAISIQAGGSPSPAAAPPSPAGPTAIPTAAAAPPISLNDGSVAVGAAPETDPPSSDNNKGCCNKTWRHKYFWWLGC